MKRVFLAALLPLSVLAGPVSLSFITGYGLPFPAQSITTNISSNSSTATSTTSGESVLGSYADGLRVGGELGFAVNEWVTLGIGFRYEKSSEIESSNETVTATFESLGNRKSAATSIAGIPSFMISAPGEILRPFIKVNGRVGKTTLVSQYDFNTTSTTGTDIQYQLEYSGGLSLGFGGGFGVEYKLSDRISVLGEILTDSWSYDPTDGKYTKYISNGADVLSERTVAQNQIKFVDSYTTVGTADPNSPSQQLRLARSYSAVALNLGLKLQF
jgi:hypothetical protein